MGEGPAKGPKPGVLNTLPERIALARREGLDYADSLQIVLADEVSRRDHGRLELRQRQAGFEQLCRLEDFDWSAYGWPESAAPSELGEEELLGLNLGRGDG